MNMNWNPRGSRGVPTTGTNAPPTANQAQPSGCNLHQQHQLPTRLQCNCFKGSISELCGHIYDLVGICSATTQAIATYTGHKLGGDICCSIETFTLATLTIQPGQYHHPQPLMAPLFPLIQLRWTFIWKK